MRRATTRRGRRGNRCRAARESDGHAAVRVGQVARRGVRATLGAGGGVARQRQAQGNASEDAAGQARIQ
eukprot:843099-Prymnesium_polylepis.1